MRTSDKVEQVCASMFAVQRDLELPKTNASGQARGAKDYRYLDLPGMIDHLKPLLSKYQLFVTQEDLEAEGGVAVRTTVWHFSGQYLEFGPAFVAVVGDEQKQGAAKTYCRRYALAAAFNLAADKDTDAAQRGSWGQEAAPSRPASRETSTGASTAPPVDEGAPASDTREKGATRTGAPTYLSKDDQRLLIIEYGSNRKAIDAYAARFGERVQRVADITYEMRDGMMTPA